jgi:tryptophanyl-tRNA synthetase
MNIHDEIVRLDRLHYEISFKDKVERNLAAATAKAVAKAAAKAEAEAKAKAEAAAKEKILKAARKMLDFGIPLEKVIIFIELDREEVESLKKYLSNKDLKNTEG